jgi:hypothetical protein
LVAVAVKVTEVPAQMVLPEGAMETDTGSLSVTFIVMGFEVAGLPEGHGSLEVILTVTISPWAKSDVTRVAPVAPEIRVAPLYHWYVGVVPPLTGVAVKVTSVPLQMVPAGEADMETLAGRMGFTCMGKAFEVAGDPDWHVSEEVRTQVMTSPCFREALLYVDAFEPTLTPLSFH